MTMLDRYSKPEMRALWSDQSKIDRWLEVELAVVDAWADLGVVPPEDAEVIRSKARATPDEVAERESVTHHDLAAFVDVAAAPCGDAGRWIHFGLTSSDVLDTGLALQLREASRMIRVEAVRYFETLKARAFEYSDTPCVGRTHGIHAEPTTFGAKLASFAFEALRFIDRLDRATEAVCVGKIAGAVGSYATVPPEVEALVCQRLHLGHESAPTQIVGRDRIAAYVGCLALGAAAVERFALEVRHLQRSEVGEVEEPFGEGQKGSSAMPHKKNPVASERLCGLARVLRAAQNATLEDVALWHERDISHSSVERMLLPQATSTLHFMFCEATRIAAEMRVYPDRMRHNLELTGGMVFSQRLLLSLVRHGIDRDHAYRLVQSAALRSLESSTPLMQAALEDKEISASLQEGEIRSCFSLDDALANLSVVFDRLRDARPKDPPIRTSSLPD